MRFLVVLNEAAKKAVADGTISSEDLNVLRRARFHPFMMAIIKKQIAEEAVMSGVLPVSALGSMDDVDWEKVLNLTTEIIPLVIQLINELWPLFT